MASPEALPAKPDGGIASVDRRDGLETYIPDGRERQAVMLHLQGYSLREIASSLNCSVTLAWKLFHAGRNRLPPGFLDPS